MSCDIWIEDNSCFEEDQLLEMPTLSDIELELSDWQFRMIAYEHKSFNENKRKKVGILIFV